VGDTEENKKATPEWFGFFLYAEFNNNCTLFVTFKTWQRF
jgi:hypothetical protein